MEMARGWDCSVMRIWDLKQEMKWQGDELLTGREIGN